MFFGGEEGRTRVGRDEGAGLNTAGYVIEVPDLVELVLVLALDGWSDASRGFECGNYGIGSVGCR